MTARIYSLPTETLARIFQEAICHHGHDETLWPIPLFSSPITLASVCRLWRSIATGSRSLWAHLDILMEPSSRYPSSAIWLRYLQDSPIQVHIRQRALPPFYSTAPLDQPSKPEDPAPQEPYFWYSLDQNIPRLMTFLNPLMQRASRLEIIAGEDLRDLLTWVSDVIADLPKQSNLPKELVIIYAEDFGLLRFNSLVFQRSAPSQSVERFFASLTKLDLRGVIVDWGYISNLPNLIDLRLEKPNGETDDWPITQDQLIKTLSSCPKLRSLILFNIQIKPHQSETEPQPVVLPELRVLSVRCMVYSREMELVISAITPGPHPLHMSVELCEEDELIDSCLVELRSFISRSNVTILDVHSRSFYRWFATQLGPLPNVHTLALHYIHFSDKPGSAPSRRVNPEPMDHRRVIWPQVRTLHLASCGLEERHFRPLVSMHSIETLYLHRCFDDTLSELAYNQHAMLTFQEHFKTVMSDLIPNIITTLPTARNETADWLFVGSPM
ncbi:F-box-like domain-containing protein [Ceratobasidium sp. AG-Ba]|nr:F-box-like domain-containing protein [Ceratobasidium sp. AG-Ba]